MLRKSLSQRAIRCRIEKAREEWGEGISKQERTLNQIFRLGPLLDFVLQAVRAHVFLQFPLLLL